MTTPAAAAPRAAEPPKAAEARDFQTGLFCAFLSYLVPGLGQIVQGRVFKGAVFLVAIYALFFYGMYLGSGTAVVDAKTYKVQGNVYLPPSGPGGEKAGFLSDLYNRPQFAGQFWVGAVAWPAVVQYLYYNPNDTDGLPVLGKFMRTPEEKALNAVTVAGDKTLELGWVYTVIAGVLNIIIMYDALCGPTFYKKKPAVEAKAS